MSTSATYPLYSNLRPPLFRHRRAPGPWSWNDFKSGPPAKQKQHPGQKEQVDIEAQRTFRKHLCAGWTPDRAPSADAALGTLPKAGSVYQINARTTGEFDIYKKMDSLKSSPENQPHPLGTYLFVDLSEPLLLQLGSKYDMDPDFFRACFDRSASQSASHPLRDSDHMRITLPFLFSSKDGPGTGPLEKLTFSILGIYLVRSTKDTTIVVWYPAMQGSLDIPLDQTYNWMAQMGIEAEWAKTNRETKDSTFLIFPILWWVVYAWCDAIADVYSYLDSLEEEVLKSPTLELTKRIHTIRSALLNYKSLLEDFRKTVRFIHSHLKPMAGEEVAPSTYNNICTHPQFNSHVQQGTSDGRHWTAGYATTDQRFQRYYMEIDAEIFRLANGLDRRNQKMQDVMNMVSSHVTISDSASMKQIAWITMAYIPPTFVAGVFGMNVTGIGIGVTTLVEYVWIAIIFTFSTRWLVKPLLCKKVPWFRVPLQSQNQRYSSRHACIRLEVARKSGRKVQGDENRAENGLKGGE
ncbi:hypothetical protein B0H14DRAFT_2772676 [Mycena olivaceomarginata]|nr:hypothetical protein B0H14DRAFT_2772676 [Mycena olivaceomarginata]